jgi:hypothetical protein
MPFYYALRREPVEVRRRAAEGLLRLRAQLNADGVPRRTVGETLLLATWNIREFDSEKYGRRLAESFYYIAEIVSHFDLVAVQEVREDLAALDRLQSILGGWWKYIVTDVTEGAGGNGERMAFLYDSRKVTFGGLAGEIVLPDVKGERALQLARTPFVCGFKAGWTKFNLCTVHIYYGDQDPNNERRVREIDSLARLLARRAKEAPAQPARPDGKVTAVRNTQPENLILLGDFNIFGHNDLTMQALVKAGFTVPPELQPLPGSNLDLSKHYDQIAFMVRPERFGTTGRAGVFDFYKSVFPRDEHEAYAALMPEKYKTAANPKRYYNDWRTHQMSDHLLLWVELKIDYGREYLEDLKENPRDAGGFAEGGGENAAGSAGGDSAGAAPSGSSKKAGAKTAPKKGAAEPASKKGAKSAAKKGGGKKATG